MKLKIIFFSVFVVLCAHGEFVSFDKDRPGEVPKAWLCGLTGSGTPLWSVIKEDGAPSKPHVLKQSGKGTFPWCTKTDAVLTDGYVEVRFKAHSGEEDQAAGVVWRWKDRNNYYVARANALENNVSLYYVENGKRHTLKYVEGKDIDSRTWPILRVEFLRKNISVKVNGKTYIEMEDDHISGTGTVGVWTKADSVTSFDDFGYGPTSEKNTPASLPSKNEVVVYTSIDDVFARPIAEKFEKTSGITVKLVPDTEETKSTGLLNRLIAEKNRPQADVFWSGDPVRAAILKQKGLSASYFSPNARDLPQRFSDRDGYWTGFSARARVLLYNKGLVLKNQVPQSVMDLLDERFKDRGCMANPLFGTTSMHAAALFDVLGDEKAKKFFEGFSKNGGRLLSSNGEVRRRVAAGDFAIGITDTDDGIQAIREGKPVGIVYPDRDGIGTLIVPNVAVLILSGPNPQAAKKFIDFLLSSDTEKMLAEGEAAQMPLRAGISLPAEVTPLNQLNPMKVEYSKLAQRLEGLSRGYLKDWVAHAKK